MRMTFDPAALECLAAIVEEGGFERAAQRLSITQSAVSQRLRALEAQVGTVLIVRSRPLQAHLGRPAAAQAHQAAAPAARRPGARPARNWRPARWAARARKSASPSPSTPTASPPGPAGADGPGAAGPAAGDHHRRPGLHPRMAARRPGAGLRHHAQAGAARLQGGAAGRDAVRMAAPGFARERLVKRAPRRAPRAHAHNFRDVPFVAFNRKDDMQASSSARPSGSSASR
jgi:LysR family transcriptional regulator (chromosome initiation inhibitor)